jgi:L-rhamnose mutarotase
MSAAAPERIGLFWRIAAGRESEYDERHAEMWPELERRLHDLGVRSFSIYRRDDLVFGHLEVDDYAELVEAYAQDPLAETWERDFEGLIEMDEPDPTTGWPERLRHVWSLRSAT